MSAPSFATPQKSRESLVRNQQQQQIAESTSELKRALEDKEEIIRDLEAKLFESQASKTSSSFDETPLPTTVSAKKDLIAARAKSSSIAFGYQESQQKPTRTALDFGATDNNVVAADESGKKIAELQEALSQARQKLQGNVSSAAKTIV